MDYLDLDDIYRCYMQICGMPEDSLSVERYRGDRWYDTARQICSALGKNASEEQVRIHLGIPMP
jgi:hypothetical protein